MLQMTDLYTAASRGSLREVQAALLVHPEQLNSRRRGGRMLPPLHLAADMNREPEIINALVDAGAELEHEGSAGHTAVYYAAHHTSPRALRALLRHGARVTGAALQHAATAGSDAALGLLLAADPAAVNIAGLDGRTLLWSAAGSQSQPA